MKNQQLQNALKFWKKLSSGSVNRQIFGAAVTVTGMSLLVKIVSVGKEFIVAWRFGTSHQVDAFAIAWLLPNFVTSVVTFSFNPAFIPTYIQMREQQRQQEAQQLLSGAISYLMGLLILVTILMVACSPLYLPVVASGFDSRKIALTSQLLVGMSPVIILSGIFVICKAVLSSGEHFALAAVSPIATPTLSIIFMLIFPSWGVFALVAGLIGGLIIQIILLGISLHKKGVNLVPKLYYPDSNLKEVFGLYGSSVTAGFLMANTTLVDRAMAAMLEPGSVAALSYGHKLTALPLALATVGLRTTIMPYYSKMIAREDWQSVKHTLQHYLKLIWMTTIPITIILVFFSTPIIRLLLQRGSFTANDTYLVSQIQSFYVLQVPFYVANILVTRLINSMKMNYIFTWTCALNLLVNILCNFIFLRWIGVAGIALSTACVYIVCFCVHIVFVIQKINKMSQQK